MLQLMVWYRVWSQVGEMAYVRNINIQNFHVLQRNGVHVVISTVGLHA